jgi:hypothetical protein
MPLVRVFKKPSGDASRLVSAFGFSFIVHSLQHQHLEVHIVSLCCVQSRTWRPSPSYSLPWSRVQLAQTSSL